MPFKVSNCLDLVNFNSFCETMKNFYPDFLEVRYQKVQPASGMNVC